VKVIATAKSVRITSRKARLVADSVIGLPVAEALAVLSFTPRHAAKEVAKVIKSAAANAEHNYNLEASSLRVERIDVDQAGIMKRFIPKPRGMAGSLFKRMSHLRCYVTDEEPEPDRRRRSVVAMPGRSGGQGSTRPAATRRRRPAQLRRAQEAATAAAVAEEEATTAAAAGEEALEAPATSVGDKIETSETDALDPGAAEADAGEAEADAAQDDEEKD
jgi:large subunit ribosomal protein L22